MQRGATYKRKKNDWYATPPGPVEALLSQVRFRPVVCDPCCGDGALAEPLKKMGYNVRLADIAPQTRARTVDFLTGKFPFSHVDIITNPPYGAGGRLAVKFIERALEVTKPWQGRVAMLLAADFDSAKTRVHLFRDSDQFDCKLVLLDRIVFFERPGASPATNHAWFIWDWKNKSPNTNLYAGWKGTAE